MVYEQELKKKKKEEKKCNICRYKAKSFLMPINVFETVLLNQKNIKKENK